MRSDAAAMGLLLPHFDPCMRGARRRRVPGQAELACWYGAAALRRWRTLPLSCARYAAAAYELMASRAAPCQADAHERLCAGMAPGQLGAGPHTQGQAGSAGMGMPQAPPQALRVRRPVLLTLTLAPVPPPFAQQWCPPRAMACAASSARARRQRGACAAGVLVGGRLPAPQPPAGGTLSSLGRALHSLHSAAMRVEERPLCLRPASRSEEACPRGAQMGSGGGMMGLSNGMIPVQGPGAQVPSMVPVGLPPGGPPHMQGAHPAPLSRTLGHRACLSTRSVLEQSVPGATAARWAAARLPRDSFVKGPKRGV